MEGLTERQQREIEYHRDYIARGGHLRQKIAYGIIAGDRWWNQGWAQYGALRRTGVEGKRVLVIGCGFGVDVLRIAKMGGEVYGFDLSAEAIEIAQERLNEEGLTATLAVMPAERLTYPDGFFDLVFARDIMHHVDIPQTMRELQRVCKSGAKFIVNEPYTHSIPDRIRHSRFVDGVLYPALKRFVYGADPYITQDERKLNEKDVREIASIARIERKRYFHLFVMRLLPDKWRRVSQADQLLLASLGPLGSVFGGRILMDAMF